MHLFLTGAIQSGKSFALRRALSRLGIVPGGFQTYFGPDRANPERLLYLCGAGELPVYGEDHIIARFSEGAPVQVFSDRFDGMGAELIRTARRESGLIVMDECGYLERKALLFQDEVLRCLDGETPVLGVVRLREGSWTEKIKNHPRVKVLTVTEETRDSLPQLIFAHYQHLA